MYRWLARGVVAGLCLVAGPPVLLAQDQHEHAHEASGASGWTFMHDGVVDAIFNRQGSPRGGEDLEVTNWWMGMLGRQRGRHQITLTGMFSLDAFTAGKAGYREIFQVGESLDGRPLVDRQHPHDVFMQLSAAWRLAVSDATTITLVGAPVGEPAIGPPAFMHRGSAAAIPFAPLGHHTFDSTHISFGVVNAAVALGRWAVEGSLFNGREPDDRRWDFDFGRMDSVAARGSFRPAPQWALQVSSARLINPESLEPGTVVRTTASASWMQSDGGRLRAATAGYGVNAGHGVTRHAVFGEFTRQFAVGTMSSRLEILQVESGLLLGEDEEGTHGLNTLAALTFGAVREFGHWKTLAPGVGAALTFHAVPDGLRAEYGRRPTSFQLFVQVRVATEGMGTMWK